MPKLLYITNGISGSGGLERVLSIKASGLADCFGYEVHILTLNQRGLPPFYQFSKKIVFHDIEAKGNVLRYFFSYKRGIVKTIHRVGPDIVSVCDDGLKGLFVPLYFKKKIPIIYERHTVKHAFQGTKGIGKLRYYIFGKLADYGSRLYDRFVVLTAQNTKEWRKATVRVIPNPNSFYTSSPSILTNKKVISVGTMSHVKGFDLLLNAWKIVSDKHPDWHLDIYGKPVLKKELLQLAQKLNIKNHVSLHDPVDDIEEKYKSASIYVLSSRYEGFGMVLIEAMACGLPCVSFDCPLGPADIINDGVDGYLVAPNDVEALAEKIILMLEEEEKRKQMGQSARQTAMNYMPDKIVEKWDVMFKELIT